MSSFFSGGKSKEKDPVKKSQFYVEFLGWMECRGLRGQNYTDPVIKALQSRHKKMEAPPKLTIKVSRKDLKITQEVEEKKKRTIRKIKFPTIPARDVSFVHQSSRLEDGGLDDIVACIYLGYMPRTQKYVHVHVYRFDEASTASHFVKQMDLIIESNQDHVKEVEAELINKNEIDDPRIKHLEQRSEPRVIDSTVGSASSVHGSDEFSNFSPDQIDPDLQSLIDFQPFQSVAEELKHRLQMGDAPLLLPPKDYDTISRAHGNLNEINKIRSLNQNIIGVNNIPRDKIGSNDIDVNLVSVSSDANATDEMKTKDKLNIAPFKLVEKPHSPSMPTKQQNVSAPFKYTTNSPQVFHGQTNFYEAKLSPKASHKPKVIYESKFSPQTPTNFFYEPETKPPKLQLDNHDLVIPSKGIYSGKELSENDYAYPLVASSSTYINTRSTHQQANAPISKQDSHSSEDFNRRKLSDESQSRPSVHHIKYGSTDDIYALSFKVPKQVLPTDELPPDYHDDDDLQLPRMNQPYGQAFLTRSLPPDIIREKLSSGNIPITNSGELRLDRRNDPSGNVKGAPRSHGNEGMYSSNIQRYGSSKR
uniref:PID domain-containing protein n=2 Tax=Arion vulgaris TaxID=1028688 RepID=A0A0B7AS73_9EUPU